VKRPKARRAGPKRKGAKPAPRRRAAGLPDEASVIAEKPFVSPKGRAYRIIRTTETDAYDKPGGAKKRGR
jgi:hypothetical protein